MFRFLSERLKRRRRRRINDAEMRVLFSHSISNTMLNAISFLWMRICTSAGKNFEIDFRKIHIRIYENNHGSWYLSMQVCNV